MDAVRNFINNLRDTDKVGTEVIVGIVLCIIILVLYYSIDFTISKLTNVKKSKPVLYRGLKPADIPVTIHQDPNKTGSVTIYRSQNEKSGIEFSFTVWLWIDTKSWNTTNKKWKHVFHKGPLFDTVPSSSNSKVDSPTKHCEIQCPGLWIDGNTNKLKLCVNTFGINDESLEVDNLPVKKWVCFIYTQSNFVADVYINGRLKIRKELRTLPRQNYSNIHVNADDGYTGYLSELTYYRYALNASEIHDITEAGPNLKFYKQRSDTQSSVKIDNEIPYLSDRWWNTTDFTREY